MHNFSDEAKYRKKRPSSISKASRKADHKHIADQEIMLIFEKERLAIRTAYCAKCNRIINTHCCETERMENGCYRMLHEYELIEKYKHLPMYISQDYRRLIYNVDYKIDFSKLELIDAETAKEIVLGNQYENVIRKTRM